ncbi:DUF397 domain-containing protein [Streptomyces sp. NPDC059743]|uniref:DUF397 domain-containing protein n=1 Tax=Streptomyces sp. NPDC059743 TaxID=3346928 RepID=UPI0036591DEE
MSTEQVAVGTAQLHWFKSSYSGSGGGNCVEVAWIKSSYSGTSGGECVEVATTRATTHLRDSKNPQGPILRFPADQWATFISYATTQICKSLQAR